MLGQSKTKLMLCSYLTTIIISTVVGIIGEL